VQPAGLGCYGGGVSDPSLIQRLLDPTAAPAPAQWLWPLLAAGSLGTLAGLAAMLRLLKTLGPPTGDLPRSATVPAIGFGLGALVLPELMAGMISDGDAAPLARGLLMLLGTLACIAGLMAVQLLGSNERKLPQWLQARPRSLLVAGALWLLLTPTLIACMLASVAAVQLLGGDITQQPQVQDLGGSNSAVWISGWYVTAAMAAPLREEFAFRLVLYGVLAGWLAQGQSWRDRGRLVALAMAGFLFVAAHGNWPAGFAPLALLAIVLTASFAHSRSIWPPVLIHALHNALVVTIQFFVPLQ